jgi:hypothetical protein
MQLFFIVGSDNLGSREGLSPVHPHIEGTIHTDGETSFGGIELVTADAEVGENAIYLRYTLQAKYSLQVTKVVGQKNESSWGTLAAASAS